MWATLAFATDRFAIAEPGTPRRLNYVVTFQMRGERPRLHVEFEFDADVRGATRLRLPSGWDGQESLDRAIENLRVTSTDATIVEGDKPHIRIIAPPPAGSVRVEYDVVQDWPGESVRQGVYNRVILQPSYLYALGHSLLVMPDWDDGQTVDVRIAWNDVPQGWMLNNSFGPDQASPSFTATFDELKKAVFVAGDFRTRVITIRDRPVHVVTRGVWRFADEEFLSLVARTVEAEREFWNDHDFAHLLVVLLPIDEPPEVNGGEARTNAIALYFSKDLPDTSGMKFILAHELFHTWNPTRLGGQRDDKLYWFSEGFTDHYAAVLLRRSGLVSEEEYLTRANDVLRRYHTSPARNHTNEQLQADRNTSGDALRQVYVRGNVLALTWDAEIRAATEGRYSLDDVMRELRAVVEARASPLSYESINEAARRHFPAGVMDDIDRYIEQGQTIPPRGDLLGPEAEMELIEVALFDPGFDVEGSFAERVFVGVRPGGPAHKAGMRDGQKWVKGGLVRDPAVPAEFTVEQEGVQMSVEYLPASEEKVQVPRFR